MNLTILTKWYLLYVIGYSGKASISNSKFNVPLSLCPSINIQKKLFTVWQRAFRSLISTCVEYSESNEITDNKSPSWTSTFNAQRSMVQGSLFRCSKGRCFLLRCFSCRVVSWSHTRHQRQLASSVRRQWALGLVPTVSRVGPEQGLPWSELRKR